MDDLSLMRYSKHILLPRMGYEGQTQLLASTVMVVGLGGLGCVVAQYLAASGVGRLILVDPDRIELSNLSRQILYTSEQQGEFKAQMAAQRLSAINPEIVIDAYSMPIQEFIDINWSDVSIVVDATDNFKTRFWLNAHCLSHQIPLVMGSCIGYEGQVGVFAGYLADAPCYGCLYSESVLEEPGVGCCTDQGVLSPLPGIIGAWQATEVIKLLTGSGKCLASQLLCVNTQTMTQRIVNISRDPMCTHH